MYNLVQVGMISYNITNIMWHISADIHAFTNIHPYSLIHSGCFIFSTNMEAFTDMTYRHSDTPKL